MKKFLVILLLLSTVIVQAQDFSFVVVADIHLDNNTDTISMRKLMEQIAKDKPGFVIDLGDTFMSEKYGNQGYRDSEWQYRAVNNYYSMVGAPIHLVIGNHDGAYTMKTPELNRWVMQTRERYFPNSSKTYYSFSYKNVEIFVLDPYKFTPRTAGNNPSERTLGEEQLEWLEESLSNSKAKYKLVFTHSLVGGTDLKGKDRGGVEVANLYEWGEKIHPLLKKNGVQAVFHGHDHIFVKQQLDGIIYQCCPQPAAIERGEADKVDSRAKRIASEYGYSTGDIVGGSGYLYVSISNSGISVTFKTLAGKKYEYSL